MTRFSFDCVFHYVTDMERAISFYTDVLGLKLTTRDAVARFDIDGVLFELVPAHGEADVQGNGNARLCLEVAEIHQAVQELQSQGVETSEVQEVENGTLASFADPDGNQIFIWQHRSRPTLLHS